MGNGDIEAGSGPSALYTFAHRVLPRDLGGGGVTWGLVTGSAAEGYLAMRYAEVASGAPPPELAFRPVLPLGVADVRLVDLPPPREATHGYFAAYVREASGKLRYFVLEKADLGPPVLGEWQIEGAGQIHVHHGPVSEDDVTPAQRAMMPEPHAAAFVVAITKVVARAAPAPSAAAPAAPTREKKKKRARAPVDGPLAAHEIPDFRAPSSGATGGGGLSGLQQVRLVLIAVKLVFVLMYLASKGC